MNKILIAGCMLLAAFAAVAMPNKKELAKAQRLVEDVTRADIKALKAGAKTPKEVAETHLALAAKSSSDAEKYLLLQGAFKLYARGGDYEAAATTLVTMNRDIDGIPPELMLELIDEEFHRGMGEKAPKVLQIYKTAKRTVKCRKELAVVEAALKAKPKDTTLNRKHGECLAELGNWKGAAAAFARAGGEVSKMIAAEGNGNLPPQQIADFWWDYNAGDAITSYKMHAAKLYQKAFADAKFAGLARTRAEQRVREVETVVSAMPMIADMMVAKIPAATRKEPFVFDLGSGVRKLELLRCPAGTYTMGYRVRKDGKNDISTPHKVRISRPFWLAKCPLTISQMKALVPAFTGKDRRPDLPGKFPDNADAPLTYRYWNKEIFDAFFAELNRRFASELPLGYVFRYPTAAEWEYALRDGGDGTYVQKDGMLAMSQRIKRTGVVCELKPNAWGFYDMLGMAGDFFLDSGDFVNLTFPQVEIDPIYGLEEGKHAMIQGGKMCLGDRRHDYNPLWNSFRLCIGPDLVAEKANKLQESPTQNCGEKVLWIAKDKDIKLSMIHCPSGTFRKGFEKYSVGDVSKVPSALIPHDVKISRPFWMAKYPMTYAQVKELAPSLVDGKDWPSLIKAHGQYVVFSGADGLDAAAVCRELNARFKAEMPSGYVFRLPTEAEWEYCLKEGGKCSDNRLNREGVYSDRAATSWTEDRKAAHPEVDANRGCGVGTLKPNAWDLYDMIGTISQLFLDNGPFQCGVAASGVAVDPFQNDGSSKNHVLYPKPGGNASMLVETGRQPWTGFRVVLAPDLVAEKTARQRGVVNKNLSEKHESNQEDLYLEIDLSGGVNAKSYPTRVVSGAVNANTDEYKTDKLLLKYVKPGKFLSGDSVRAKDKCKEVTIQSGYLLGVFEVTQRQWELVMGNRPSFFMNATDYAMRPVESVTRDEIGSFINHLNPKLPKDCGAEISLPYAQQWEYACRAGTSSDWYNGKSYLSNVDERLFFEIGRCRDNGGWSVSKWGAFVGKWEGAWQGRNSWMSQYPVKMRNCGSNFGTAKVGSYKPNAWGFYDMLGNVSEQCYKDGCRGGNVRTTAKECIPTDLNGSGLTHYNIGFRVSGQVSSDKWNEKLKTRK